MKLLCIVVLFSLSGVLALYTPNALRLRSQALNRVHGLQLSLVEKEEESASSRIAEISRTIIQQELSSTPLPATEGKARFKRGQGKLITEEIEALFDDNKHLFSTKKGTKASDLTAICTSIRSAFDKHFDALNHIHAITLLYKSAKSKFDISKAIPLSKIIEVLQRHKENSQTTHRSSLWHTYELSKAMYCLRMFDNNTQGVREYISLLIEKIEECNANGKHCFSLQCSVMAATMANVMTMMVVLTNAFLHALSIRILYTLNH